MEILCGKLQSAMGPSIHRSRWGIKEDHALVSCTWKWRLREVDVPARLDYSSLLTGTSPWRESVAGKLNEEFKTQLNLLTNGHSAQ